MSLTPAQQQAVAARGNVLVVAGAGTGKTRALVERCLSCLIDEQPPVSLDEIFVVTFTEAAAAEMKHRLRARLEEELAKASTHARWQEQIALFDTAHIGTLHSFCFQLVRQHFLDLGLDPQLVVMPDEEASLLAVETLDSLLESHYAGRDEMGQAVQSLIQIQGQGREDQIRALVRRLHHYTQSLPDPAGWFRQQLDLYAAPDPHVWQQWFLDAIADWRREWLPLLESLSPANNIARTCAAALKTLQDRPALPEPARALEQVVTAFDRCPPGNKTRWVEPLEDFIADARFLASLTAVAGDDPLAADWNWVRPQMTTLLRLTQQFASDFTDAKRERAAVDFHDLEQHALRLLWDNPANQPTAIARQWRQKLRFVFVDEYQDINAAQDKIIQALSRDGAEANRFLVGDMKQSIYRFRLANPRIFQNYVESWDTPPTAGAVSSVEPKQAVRLVENFRSGEGVLDFVNALFGLLMRRDVGGVEYDQRAQLQFGAPQERQALACTAGNGPRAELHLRLIGTDDDSDSEDENGDERERLADLLEADKEARLVALRLIEMKAARHPVWDESAKGFRPVEWRDMAVLLRSPANKAESYAKEFARLNVPLLVTRSGFYESLEVLDLLNLLHVLDNPLQDHPVLATLHSPLAGLTLDELATIRLAGPGRFWTALVRWQEEHLNPAAGAEDWGGNVSSPLSLSSTSSVIRGRDVPSPAPNAVEASPDLRDKVARFLNRFARWRRLARQVSLTRCLETVLAETHYAEWLLTQPRGHQRHANLQRLLGLAQQFDQFQRRGLFRFLRFIDAQQAAELVPDVPAVSDDNAVRLMSIHQSKGLEFPVVVVSDLGKAFNLRDLHAEIILDEVYGLCAEVQPPLTPARYPSLPHWLASRREKRELLGEELRLLYVAMTRARDALLLSASISRRRFEERWKQPPAVGPREVLSASTYADWLSLWFATQPNSSMATATRGENQLVRWVVHGEAELLQDAPALTQPSAGPDLNADPAEWQALQQRLAWRYPFGAAAFEPAKTSVTALRRRAAEEADETGVKLFEKPDTELAPPSAASMATPKIAPGKPATDVGNAHHQFLQLVSLDQAGSVADLTAEAHRLQSKGAMSAQTVALLNLELLAAFWDSDVGRRIRAQAAYVRREHRFTARFQLRELALHLGRPVAPPLESEFVVVQGVADLVVLLPAEIWLLDFKTDAINEAALARRSEEYSAQIRIYAQALSRIYQRPVSERWLYFLTLQRAVPIP